jgi:murein DD-endopeptidase MepM/ murein hydrolase activator NlpD
MELEVLKGMLSKYKKAAKKLNDDFFINAKNIDDLGKKVKVIKDAILEIENKRAKIKKLQLNNKRALIKLNMDREKYKKALKKLLRKQDTLKKTLAGLNIIRIDEQKRAREKKARELAFKKKKQMQKREYKNLNSKKYITSKNLPKVKRYADSYQAVKTKPYRGPKTIAPLKEYTITKKYGTYTDPIYGIKIFNESISLKPKRKNVKVRNVFNGKVIYADKTAVLNNIVIVENRGGIHTIYANLSKIAPNIKKGFKIKKGYVIGRVKDELVFEVTQKSYHINPIRLFKFR